MQDIGSKGSIEQPFPDSWISTTASIALGTLTDISSEILLGRGAEGGSTWRSTVAEIYQYWCNGDITKWVPCEAVVRIATAEFERFMTRATEKLSTNPDKNNVHVWSNHLIGFYSDILGKNLVAEEIMMNLLLEEKCGILITDPKSSSNNVYSDEKSSSSSSSGSSSSGSSSSGSSSSGSSSSDGKSVDEPSTKFNEDEQHASDTTNKPKVGPLDNETTVGDVEINSHLDKEVEDDTEENVKKNEDEIIVEEQEESEGTARAQEGNETAVGNTKTEMSGDAVENVERQEDDSFVKVQAGSEDSEENFRKHANGSTSNDEVDSEAIARAEGNAGGAIEIDYGTLQRQKVDRTDLLPIETFARLDEKFNTRDSPNWMKLLPALKLRCVAAHYLQHILLSLREEQLIGFISQETISNLLNILSRSRIFAEKAVKNEDLAHAFQEAMFSEWGISNDMGEEALENVAKLNNTKGSAMFFLTQTASATNGVIRLLSDLYDHDDTLGGEQDWDRRAFAGQYLLKIKVDIFRKFTESDAKEGHKVDQNVWRNTTESGVKVAIYCTSFASVVVGLLKAMLSFEPSLIERNKAAIFPLMCELVGVRSEEIRKLVRRVLIEKFGPLLGLGQDTGWLLPMRDSVENKDSFG